MRQQQSLLYDQLRTEALASRERIVKLVRPLDGARLAEHPEPKGWSIGQVLEHLIVSDEAYVEPLKKLMSANRPDAAAPLREWKSTIIGGFIAGALGKPRPVKTRPVFEPGPSARNGVVEAFIANEMGFVTAMDDAANHDWRALKIASPALPGFMPKMNLGDAFRIHVVHVTRHAAQIERLAGKVQH